MAQMNDLKPGDWIAGEYRVRRVFGGKGRSGMGVVYLVEGRSSEEPFVLKTFQAGEENPELIRRFEKEAMTWVNLGKHPNLVECFWARKYDAQLFVAAEYVWPDPSGRNTLAQHIGSTPTPLEKQVEWISQCCFAMRHAAKSGLGAHRDIKPENMMIDGAGCLKLTDFGLVRMSGERNRRSIGRGANRGDEALTQVGGVIGTPPFMAPEQFADSSSVDHRADIYSLGVVIFMLITGGRRPIEPDDASSSVASWAAAHVQQRVRVPDSPLTAIVTRCLEKNPSRRFESFDELLESVSAVCRKNRLGVPCEGQYADAEFASQYSKAQTFLGTGEFSQAEQLLRTMTERWPKRSIVHTELSGVLLATGRWQEAADAARQSLELSKTSSAAWSNLGAALGNLRKIAEAKEAYGKSLLVDPENSGAMISLASLYMKIGELEKARQAAELAYFWRPEKQFVLRVLGECYLRCREAGKAADVYRKLIDRDPSDSVAWFNLALCYQSTGAFAEQILVLEELLKRKPDDGGTVNILIQAHVNAGQMGRAIKTTERLQQIPGWEVVAIAKRAQLFAAQGDFMTGYLALNNALKRHERSAILWFTMAAVLREQPRYRSQAAAAVQNAILCAEERSGQLTPEELNLLRRWVEPTK